MEPLRFNRLLRNAQKDRESILEIYKEYSLKIKIHIRSQFGDAIDAEDMIQDLFLKLMSNPTEGFVHYPTSWLFKLVDNHVKDVLRSLHPTSDLYDVEDDFDLGEIAVRADVKKALSELDEVSQKIVYLHHWEGYRLNEIAHEMDLTYGCVRMKISRAYKILKEILD